MRTTGRLVRRHLVAWSLASGAAASTSAHAQDTDVDEAPVVQEEPPQAECAARLSGVVRDVYTDEPLPQANVSAGDATEGVVTGADGRFVLDGLCGDATRLSVSRKGYAPVVEQVAVPREGLEVVLAPVEEEIVVETARLGTEELHAHTTLTGDVLERTRGRGLADALSQVSGVSVLRGTSDNGKPIVRGQYGRRLLLLFDRTRLESQQWGLDHGPEIDPFAAGSLTVIKGAAGVRYGPDAIGGVVLADPLPLREEPGVDGEAHLVGFYNGLRGTIAARVDGAHAKVPGLAWRVEGNLSKGQAVSAPDYVLGNTGSEQWNAAGTLGYARPHFDLKVSYRHHAMQAGVCYCIANSTPADFLAQLARTTPVGAERWTSSYTIDRPFQAVTHDLALARVHADVGDAGVIEATYSFQVNRRAEFEQVRDNVTGPQFDFTLRTHHLDVSFAHDAVELGHGTHLEGTVGVSGQFQENVYQGLPLTPNFRAFDFGVFAFERVWARRFEVEIGARYDHQSLTSFLTGQAFRRHVARQTLGEDDCTLVDDTARCGRSFDTASVSVGALARAVEDVLSFKLDLSSANRFPDVDELYINGTAPSFPVYGLGDPSLGIETTWGANLSAQLRTDWVVGEVSAYVNYIDNYIYFAPEIGQDGQPAFDVVIRGAFPRFRFRGIDALYYGFDGGFTVGPEFPLELVVQSAIVRADNLTDGGFLVFVPPDRVQGTLTYKPPERGRVSHSFLSITGGYVARQDRVDPAADLAPPPDDFFLLGAAAGTQLRFGKQELKVAVEAQNLLDTGYRDYTSLLRYYADERGRDVLLRLSVHFTI